ncbi:hypothetical protein AB0N88_08095 [Streptomyces sp. NPDC093516]|uniref:hypothetical protein n=1 Tax=Streptomyces sp. NPDC093516 TaxID=3155304 RepID=UPI00344584EE
MSSPDRDLSHPLEQVTGEKDVHPEEEGTTPGDPATESDDGRTEDAPPEASEDTEAP